MPSGSETPPRAAVSHYDILGPLGQGGMGEVYIAFDTTLQRRVALKAVRRDRLDEEAQARLLREARILSQLDHPNICRIYDYVEADDSDFLVLELIDGKSLRDALRGGLDRHLRIRIAEQVAQALVAAHAAGVVHRDLKPENVMLLPGGDIKVLDFGLARAYEPAPAAALLASARHAPSSGPGASARPAFADSASAPHASDDERETMMPSGVSVPYGYSSGGPTVQTLQGQLLGTPVYMSPEQARGEAATAPSDMYAFGLLLQELYTGQRPYPSGIDLPALLDKIGKGESLPATGVSRDVADLIEQLKSLAPTRRPTAVDAAERLRRIRETPKRRLRYAAAAVLVAAAVGGAIKYTIDLNRERTAAVLAREDANQRRGQAEDLIGFMLGDLRGKLQRVGRLDVLDDVGKKAMSYFASVPPSSITEQELFRRSQAVHQIGQVRMAQGDLKTASQAFAESLQLVSALAARNPANAEWQLGLSTSHFYVGDALRLQGDLDGAMPHFTAYRDIARSLVAREPTNPKFLLELSYGHSNVAAVLEAKGDLEGSRDELAVSLDVKRRLATQDPRNREWQEALGTGHNRLGVVLAKLGDATAALDHYAADLAIRRELLAQHPNDTQIQRKVADAASWVAAIYRDQGDDTRAIEYYTALLTIDEALAARDPANADWQRELGIGETRMASVQRLRGHLDDAMRRATRAVGILQPLAARDPTLARRHRDAAEAHVELAVVHFTRGDLAPALASAEAAIASLDPVMAKMSNDIDAPRLLAEACLAAGDVWQRRGAADRARALRNRAYDMLVNRAATWKERRLQATWARALLEVGQRNEANAVIARLRESGFRRDVLDALSRRTVTP